MLEPLGEHKYGILIPVMFSLFAYRLVLARPGLVEYGDFVFPIYLKNYLTHTYPLWTDLGCYNNFEFYPRTLGYSPIFLLGYLPGVGAALFERWLLLFVCTVSGVSMYFATYLVLKQVYGNEPKTKKLLIVASIAASLIYMNNPYTINHVGHIYLRYAYGVAPLIIVGYIMTLHSQSYYRWAVLCAFLMAVADGMQHWIIYGPLLLLLYMAYHSVLSRRLDVLVEDLKRTVLVGIIYTGLVFYWLVPTLVVVLTGGSLVPAYTLSIESVLGLHAMTTVYNVLTLMSFFWPKFSFVPAHPVFAVLWGIAGMVIPASAMLGLVLKHKHRLVLFFALISALFEYLALGMKAMTPWLYEWLIFYAPLSQMYGWVFRDPNKWTQFVILSYGILAAVFIVEIVKRAEGATWLSSDLSKKAVGFFCIIAVIFCSLLFAWPGLTGDYHGLMSPSVVPQDYYHGMDYLKEHANGTKVRWLPPFWRRYTTWNHKLMGSLTLVSSPIPVFEATKFYNEYYHTYLYYLLLMNKTQNIGRHLSFSNIGFVGFHNDTIEVKNPGPPQDPVVLGSLLTQRDMKLDFHDGIVYLFKNERVAPEMYASRKNYLVVGSIDVLTSLATMKSFEPTTSALMFTEQAPAYVPQPVFHVVLFDTATPVGDFLPYFTPSYEIISPADHTEHYQYRKEWSKINAYSESWVVHLTKFNNLDFWDYDYRKGYVLTYAHNTSMNITVNVPSLDRYVLATRYLQSPNGGTLKIYLDGQLLSMIGARAQHTDFVWDFTRGLTIDGGEHTLRLEGERGFNAVNIFLLIPEQRFEHYLQEERDYVQGKRTLYLLEAESDLHRMNVNITPYRREYGCGRAVEMNPLSSLSADVEVLNTGVPYRMAIRASATKPSSVLGVSVDGMRYVVPLSSTGGMQWYYTPPLNLSERASISLRATEGVVVDTVALFSMKGQNDTLDDVFAPEPEYTHLTFERIDPTAYRVHVSTPRPFILVQGESFEPNWAAFIGGREIHSRIFYSFLNGYYIDEVGNYTFMLTYKPQTFVPYGALVSFITGVFCIFLLVVDFRRGRRGQ